MKLFDNKIIFGIFSGWGAQIISIALGIFTLPIFFRYLPKEELGLWMFFLGTSFFVNLSDFGFSPVLGRQLSFALGDGDKNSDINYTGTSYYFRLFSTTNLFIPRSEWEHLRYGERMDLGGTPANKMNTEKMGLELGQGGTLEWLLW